MSNQAELGHRERVLRSIKFRDLDRLPCYFAAENDAKQKLRQQLGVKTDLELIRFFGADAIEIYPAYLEGVSFPELQHVETVEGVESALWPGADQIDVERSRHLAEQAHATGLAVYGGVWASVFTRSRHLMGEEKYLMAMVSDPDLIHAVLEKITDSFLALNEAYLGACRQYIDVYSFGSDLGTQRSLFISPDMIRTFLLPQMARVVSQAKHFGLPVMFHTCGAIADMIPDFIDIGIDALDPVQVSATGMEIESLAARFRGKIAFRGGISTQSELPFASPDAIRETVIRTIETLGPLGYVVAPDQNLQIDTPLANIQALYDAVRGYRM